MNGVGEGGAVVKAVSVVEAVAVVGAVAVVEAVSVVEAVAVVGAVAVGRVVAVGETGGVQGVQELKEGCVVAGRLGSEHELMLGGCECF